MNFLIYLVSILDNTAPITIFSTIGALVLWGAIIFARCLGEMEDNEADRVASKKLYGVLKPYAVICLATCLLMLALPSRKSLVESYLIVHGAQVVNAENAEKAMQKFEQKIDKLISAMGK